MNKKYRKSHNQIRKYANGINKRLQMIEELEELKRYAKPYGASVISNEITMLEIEIINLYKNINDESLKAL